MISFILTYPRVRVCVHASQGMGKDCRFGQMVIKRKRHILSGFGWNEEKMWVEVESDDAWKAHTIFFSLKTSNCASNGTWPSFFCQINCFYCHHICDLVIMLDVLLYYLSQVHKYANEWRDGPFPRFERFLYIFGQDRATGKATLAVSEMVMDDDDDEEVDASGF